VHGQGQGGHVCHNAPQAGCPCSLGSYRDTKPTMETYPSFGTRRSTLNWY
jgi:hypothetical protein